MAVAAVVAALFAASLQSSEDNDMAVERQAVPVGLPLEVSCWDGSTAKLGGRADRLYPVYFGEVTKDEEKNTLAYDLSALGDDGCMQ